MDNITFKITEDGSHTLYLKDLDETYHSKHGAIQEALHVFIDAGLNFVNLPHLNILEVGFGTGLNTFLTLQESTDRSINYTSLEAYPLSEDIVSQLNYTKELKLNSEGIQLFKMCHQVEWESYQKITPKFNLNKIKVELAKYKSTVKFDVIYFDAFGPNVQPEMWEKAIFENMYAVLSDNGVLVTYCAKGSVKRTLKEVGFEVEPLPGPPGKREMTRARKL
jgi:tRNA U34 5-methylaminomethyl-2-thiouridine-forming methyltransferase MnmC